MKNIPQRVVRWLWVALVAMAVGLAGLIAVVHTAVLDVDRMNQLVSADTMPSVLALHDMALDVAALRRLLRASLDPSADPRALRTPIAQVRDALAHHEATWMRLPTNASEEDEMHAWKAERDRLDGLVNRVLAVGPSTPAASRAALSTELDFQTERLGDVIARASHINVDVASEATTVAQRVGRRLLPAAVGIEIASLLCGAFALAAAYRVARTEAALAEARMLQEKNAELEAFSGRVAHDLVSPLMSVSMALGIADQRLSRPGDEAARGMVARASGAVQRVRQVVTDLLEFARAAAPAPAAETDVAPLLESLVRELEPVAAGAGVDLHVMASAKGRVRCASGVLSSILTNLVQNAIRHADEKDRRVDVRAVEAGEKVRFEVEDTGAGVPPEDRERIFQPYVRSTQKGTGLGLGLATVKRLAESHGGQVGVSSPAREGHGALFWVSLPSAPSPAG